MRHQLSDRQKEGIELQLREYIAKMWCIPQPRGYAVGSLCSTGELLCDFHHPFHQEYSQTFWQRNGPFPTVQDYRDVMARSFIYGYQSKFPVDVPAESALAKMYLCDISDAGLVTAWLVLDLVDWSTSNIIVCSNLDSVAGIIDWEYACFIPDLQDYMKINLMNPQLEKNQWSRLLDGILDVYKMTEMST